MSQPRLSEPADSSERPINIERTDSCQRPIEKNDNDWRHPGSIPSTGRGNSDDGSTWVNPSEDQLLRACKRKGKKLESRDKRMVAAIHGEVIDQTWSRIMQYERLPRLKPCAHPKLSHFEGRQDTPSVKAKLLNTLGYPLPFDRHDWTVDRCGTQVRYVIDYYGSSVGGGGAYDAPPQEQQSSDSSSHGGSSDQVNEPSSPQSRHKPSPPPMIIDCRPAPTFWGVADRLHMQLRRLYTYAFVPVPDGPVRPMPHPYSHARPTPDASHDTASSSEAHAAHGNAQES